jgi:hypothetical protein
LQRKEFHELIIDLVKESFRETSGLKVNAGTMFMSDVDNDDDVPESNYANMHALGTSNH